MTAKIELSGTYRISGSKLISQDKFFSLHFGHRKNQTISKTVSFLVAKTTTGHPFPDTGQRDQYISSVYPLGPDKARIEYQGTGYCVIWEPSGDTVIIQPKTPNGNE